jgi:hypothetical protein
MEQKSTWLTPPPFHNSSCSHPRYLSGSQANITLWDMTQAFFILLLSAGILGANLLLVLVINSRRYSKYIHSQVGGASYLSILKLLMMLLQVHRLYSIDVC